MRADTRRRDGRLRSRTGQFVEKAKGVQRAAGAAFTPAGALCWILARVLLCLFATCWVSTFGGGPQDVVRFAVIGDSGTGKKPQYRIARQMLAWHDRLPFDLTLMLGDNIYGGLFGLGGGERKDFAKKFDKPYAALLKRGVVFRAALGNHDLEHHHGRDLVAAYDRFHIEDPRGYYRFTAGVVRKGTGVLGGEVAAAEPAPLVEFLVLNTVRLKKGDADQLVWLKKSLQRSRARWRIAYGHHPLYSTGRRHGADLRLRKQLEPLLSGQEQQKGLQRVQVVLAGHDHIYERFQPRKKVVFFVCGSSGKLARKDARPSRALAASEDRRRVFMLWEAGPEQLRFWAINEYGQAFDCGTIGTEGEVESGPCPPNPQ
ncbi:MAG: metallophosphoesterase family protein [Acidobacteriota bacterium]